MNCFGRLWAVRGKKEAEIPANLRAKPLKRKLEPDTETANGNDHKNGASNGTHTNQSEAKRIISLNVRLILMKHYSLSFFNNK